MLEENSAGLWARRGPITVSAPGETGGPPDARPSPPCAGCCSRGRSRAPCRSRQSGNHVRTPHSGRGPRSRYRRRSPLRVEPDHSQGSASRTAGTQRGVTIRWTAGATGSRGSAVASEFVDKSGARPEGCGGVVPADANDYRGLKAPQLVVEHAQPPDRTPTAGIGHRHRAEKTPALRGTFRQLMLYNRAPMAVISILPLPG